MKNNICPFKFTLYIIYPLGLLGFFVFCFMTCTGKRGFKGDNPENAGIAVTTDSTDKQREFHLPEIPAEMTDPKDRARFLVTYYWDNFDFNDTVLCHLPDIAEQALANYTEVLPHTEKRTAALSIKNLLNKAEKETTGRMYAYFLEMTDKYFYDPNSPMRDDELYIPVAEYIIEDKRSSEADKERAKFNLENMMKNRPGEKAADITYTLASGKTGKLHDIQSEYTILLFYNPDCNACAETIGYINRSPFLDNMISKRSVRILAFYPDKDINIWKNHLPDIPAEWINGYDKQQKVQNKRLYDLRAIPSLYLLDRDKNVILKDATIQIIEEKLGDALRGELNDMMRVDSPV